MLIRIVTERQDGRLACPRRLLLLGRRITLVSTLAPALCSHSAMTLTIRHDPVDDIYCWVLIQAMDRYSLGGLSLRVQDNALHVLAERIHALVL